MGDGADMPEVPEITTYTDPQGGAYYPAQPPTQRPATGYFAAEYPPAYQPVPSPQMPSNPQYPPQYAPQRPQQRAVTKGQRRMYMAQCYEELLAAPLFQDMSDEYCRVVQGEVNAFIQRRIDELMGEAAPSADGFTAQEVQALKVLAQKLIEPESRQAAAPVPQEPTPPPRRAAPQPRPQVRQPVHQPPPPQYVPPLSVEPAPPAPRRRPVRVGTPTKPGGLVSQVMSAPSAVTPPTRFPTPSREGFTHLSSIQAANQLAFAGTVGSE